MVIVTPVDPGMEAGLAITGPGAATDKAAQLQAVITAAPRYQWWDRRTVALLATRHCYSSEALVACLALLAV